MSAELSEQAKRILGLLVKGIQAGSFKLYQPNTFLGYKDVHDRLAFSMKGRNWGMSLRDQELAELARWARSKGVPAITGLIVSKSKNNRPGGGYYDVNEIERGSEDWWIQQVADAIRYDWSKFVPDYEPVTEAELAQTSRMCFEGATKEILQTVRERCQNLRRRAAELYRDSNGFLCCRVCGWHKPNDPRFVGDIVELHHLRPLASISNDGEALSQKCAIELLVPVCPTCHRLIHARRDGKQFTTDELRTILSCRSA